MYGAFLTIFGATITLTLNIYFVPIYGFTASAWTTLICYASMMIASYILGNKHYPVNYDLKRIFGYLFISLSLYIMSTYINISSNTLNLISKNLLVIVFALLIWQMELKQLLKKT
jgi:O-antigen/teichoic acid export membrane protein